VTDKMRIIKKYPNRRLYDTQTSSYITLADVKELVMAYEEFKVIDAKTTDDLTRSILLQLIREDSAVCGPVFTCELLSHLIRFYGNTMQAMLGKYLENNIKSFVDFQKQMAEQSRNVAGDTTPMQKEMWSQFLNFQGPAMQTMMAAYMDQSNKMVQQMQTQIESQARNIFTGFQFPDKKPK